MKKLKFASIAMTLLAGALLISSPLKLNSQAFISDGGAYFAGPDDKKKKVKAEYCKDDRGEVSGYGNYCVLGPGKCKPNRCDD